MADLTGLERWRLVVCKTDCDKTNM